MPRTRTGPASEQRVDERRDGAALGEDDEPAEERHHDEDGHEPVLLPNPDEGPELGDEGGHGALRTASPWCRARAPAGAARSSRTLRRARAGAAAGPCRDNA